MAYRKLTIYDEIWEYSLGKGGVKVRDPQGKCQWYSKYELLDLTKQEYNASQRKYEDDGYYGTQYPLTPGLVKKHILKQKEIK